MKAKKYVLVRDFNGEPKVQDMELVEEELPELKDNEVLLEAVYLSVDPYMRTYPSKFIKPPVTMIGEQLSKVIKTRNSKFPLGTLVLSKAGWISHYISDGNGLQRISFDLGRTPPSYCLGVLGMPGATAYFGFTKLLEPKKGETIIINGAAGAIGSIVGQLAKIHGVKVIAFVGSDAKLEWCKKDLGFDHVFNYKKEKFSEAIEKVAPDGVEMFFDSVGGEWFHTIINKHMKEYGRVVVIGSIENYNDKETKLYPPINHTLIWKDLKVQGFKSNTFEKDWPKAIAELKKYVDQGKIKVKETQYNGFDKMQEAFHGLFKGENTGKAIVKA